MSSPPPKKSERGVPVGILIIVLGTVGVGGLIALGAWGLFGMIKLTTIPLAGEWQAQGKPWRIEFRADKTIVSSTAPSQQASSQAWTSEPGRYKVDYFGNLWVMLKSGKTYTASLAPAPGETAPQTPNRFDLIESGTEVVTVFVRTVPVKPKPPSP